MLVVEMENNQTGKDGKKELCRSVEKNTTWKSRKKKQRKKEKSTKKYKIYLGNILLMRLETKC